jgi:hypothetical protein
MGGQRGDAWLSRKIGGLAGRWVAMQREGWLTKQGDGRLSKRWVAKAEDGRPSREMGG